MWTTTTINDGDLVAWTGRLAGIDAILMPLLSDVDFPIGTALSTLLAGSRRPALFDKIDESRRWVYGVVACFIGAFASP